MGKHSKPGGCVFAAIGLGAIVAVVVAGILAVVFNGAIPA